MATLSDERVAVLLEPFVPSDAPFAAGFGELVPTFSNYLDLLLKWNARTNLTAIREPEEIVQRHFGEGVFVAGTIARIRGAGTLLDLGSGAGFPGAPVQICLAALKICLAESQGKKATFLREMVRTLGLTAEVWAKRAEEMPTGRAFDVVTLRAVDNMDAALAAAVERVADGGRILMLTGGEIAVPEGWAIEARMDVPESRQRYLHTLARQ